MKLRSNGKQNLNEYPPQKLIDGVGMIPVYTPQDKSYSILTGIPRAIMTAEGIIVSESVGKYVTHQLTGYVDTTKKGFRTPAKEYFRTFASMDKNLFNRLLEINIYSPQDIITSEKKGVTRLVQWPTK